MRRFSINLESQISTAQGKAIHHSRESMHLEMLEGM
jgi:hypothetical protein